MVQMIMLNIKDKYKIKKVVKYKTNLKKIKEESKLNKYFLKDFCNNKSGFGDIFVVIDKDENEYIMKIQKKKIKKKNYILQEYEIYEHLKGYKNISQYHDYFVCNSLRCLVIEKFDIDLKNLYNNDRIFFYSKQNEFIAKIFKILEHIHNRDIIHGDVKFANIMYNFKEDKLYMIDFGCSRMWGKKYIQFEKNKRISGTLRYASLNAHMGNCINNYNDIESLLYSILEIELYPKQLLWRGKSRNANGVIERWDKIYKIKKKYLESYRKPSSMEKVFKYYKCQKETSYMRKNITRVNYDNFIKLIEIKIY